MYNDKNKPHTNIRTWKRLSNIHINRLPTKTPCFTKRDTSGIYIYIYTYATPFYYIKIISSAVVFYVSLSLSFSCLSVCLFICFHTHTHNHFHSKLDISHNLIEEDAWLWLINWFWLIFLNWVSSITWYYETVSVGYLIYLWISTSFVQMMNSIFNIIKLFYAIVIS